MKLIIINVCLLKSSSNNLILPKYIAYLLSYLSLTSLFIAIAKSQKPPTELFCKKVFLKISQNSQENTCARVSF